MLPTVRIPAATGDISGRTIGPLGARFTQVAILQGDRYISLDVETLQGGDVLVFSPRERSWLVERFQTRLFGSELGAWTHCAILDENYSVWDAMPNRSVRSRPLREVLKEPTDLTIVRSTIPVDVQRLRASLLDFSNGSYSVFNVGTAGRLIARAFRARLQDVEPIEDHETICSLFVANVLRRACQHGFLKYVPIALPADFLEDRDFAPVRLGWVEVFA